MGEAERLLDEAEAAAIEGWDFSWLDGRWTITPPPWDFTMMASDAMATASAALDMGTGGGEWLSSLPRAATTIATEAWPPNVAVAAARLAPLGVPVVQDEGAVDNIDQSAGDARGRLPFAASSFDLVVNRHEAFVAVEVSRVLRRDGVLLTQQTGSGTADLARLLGLPLRDPPSFEMSLAVAQLEAARMEVLGGEEGHEEIAFADVGALAWYLRRVPWAIPGFSTVEHRDRLLRASDAELVVREPRFWLAARK